MRKKPIQETLNISTEKVRITVEVTYRAGPGAPVQEGSKLVKAKTYELDPEHCELRFADTANEGWPSQAIAEMPSLAEDMSKVLRAQGFLVVRGMVTEGSDIKREKLK